MPQGVLDFVLAEAHSLNSDAASELLTNLMYSDRRQDAIVMLSKGIKPNLKSGSEMLWTALVGGLAEIRDALRAVGVGLQYKEFHTYDFWALDRLLKGQETGTQIAMIDLLEAHDFDFESNCASDLLRYLHQEGRADEVRLMLAVKGVKPEAKFGSEMLWQALKQGHQDMIEMLHVSGIGLGFKDFNSYELRSVVLYGVRECHEKESEQERFLDVFEAHGFDSSSDCASELLKLLVDQGTLNDVKSLLSKGITPDICTSALGVASELGSVNWEVVRELIAHGAHLFSDDGAKLLGKAATSSQWDMVEHLLKKGVGVTAVLGETVLLDAVLASELGIVEEIVARRKLLTSSIGSHVLERIRDAMIIIAGPQWGLIGALIQGFDSGQFEPLIQAHQVLVGFTTSGSCDSPLSLLQTVYMKLFGEQAAKVGLDLRSKAGFGAFQQALNSGRRIMRRWRAKRALVVSGRNFCSNSVRDVIRHVNSSTAVLQRVAPAWEWDILAGLITDETASQSTPKMEMIRRAILKWQMETFKHLLSLADPTWEHYAKLIEHNPTALNILMGVEGLQTGLESTSFPKSDDAAAALPDPHVREVHAAWLRFASEQSLKSESRRANVNSKLSDLVREVLASFPSDSANADEEFEQNGDPNQGCEDFSARRRLCTRCGKSVGKAKCKCPCKQVRYCSMTCQLAAWPEHRRECAVSQTSASKSAA